MTDRWGDSRADRDALDRWLTTEPEEAEVESRLYLVALEGPESRYNGGPETMGVWVVADTPEAATMRAWSKVNLGRREEWIITEVIDHGPVRPPDVVDYVREEPSPGVHMERLVAYPWAEHPGGLAVTATPARGGASGFTMSWPGGGHHSVQEARDLAAAILAVAAAAEERWGS